MQALDRMNDVKRPLSGIYGNRASHERDYTLMAQPAVTIFSYLRYHGGIKPRAKVSRAPALRLEEREEISRGCITLFGVSYDWIGRGADIWLA